MVSSYTNYIVGLVIAIGLIIFGALIPEVRVLLWVGIIVGALLIVGWIIHATIRSRRSEPDSTL